MWHQYLHLRIKYISLLSLWWFLKENKRVKLCTEIEGKNIIVVTEILTHLENGRQMEMHGYIEKVEGVVVCGSRRKGLLQGWPQLRPWEAHSWKQRRERWEASQRRVVTTGNGSGWNVSNHTPWTLNFTSMLWRVIGSAALMPGAML